MLKLSAKIEIKGESKSWVFEKITACEIVRDSQALTSTCKLTLPRKLRWIGESSNPIRRGDAITVWLGYDDNLHLAFKGYVVSVGIKAPVNLFCQDQMFLLKNTPMDFSLLSRDSVHLGNILRRFIDPDIPIRISDRFLVNSYYRSPADNVAHWLQHLASFGHFYKFIFRPVNGKWSLLCASDFTPNLKDIVDSYVFRDDLNIVDSDKLDARSPVPVYVYIHSMKCGDQPAFSVERGAADRAAKRFVYRRALLSRQNAEVLADFIVNRESNSFLSGFFVAFGAYMVWPLDCVRVSVAGSDLGLYIVDKVILTFDHKGYRNKIYLGPKPQ